MSLAMGGKIGIEFWKLVSTLDLMKFIWTLEIQMCFTQRLIKEEDTYTPI